MVNVGPSEAPKGQALSSLVRLPAVPLSPSGLRSRRNEHRIREYEWGVEGLNSDFGKFCQLLCDPKANNLTSDPPSFVTCASSTFFTQL